MVTHKPGCTVVCLHVSLLASNYCQWAHLSSIPQYAVRRISTDLLAGDQTEADTASSYTSIDTHSVASIFTSILIQVTGNTEFVTSKTAQSCHAKHCDSSNKMLA